MKVFQIQISLHSMNMHVCCYVVGYKLHQKRKLQTNPYLPIVETHFIYICVTNLPSLYISFVLYGLIVALGHI